MNENKKKNDDRFALALSLGIIYGLLFDNLALGLSLGILFGIVFDNKNKSDDDKKD